jgi:hypothetical protein
MSSGVETSLIFPIPLPINVERFLDFAFGFARNDTLDGVAASNYFYRTFW